MAVDEGDDDACCWRRRRPDVGAASTFETLYLAHESELFRYLARRVGAPYAEAALAEVFAIAWQRFTLRDAAVPPWNWLLGIALEQLRHRPDDEREFLESFAIGGDPSAQVARALAELTHADRDMLTLHLWADVTHESIAAVVGVEPERVRDRVESAHRFVRASIDGRRPEESREPTSPDWQ